MNKKLKGFLKAIILTLVSIIAIMFAIYTMAWFALTKKAEVILATLWTDKNFEITGKPPIFSGYPMPPKTHFSGSLTHVSGLKIESDSLDYYGFPVAHQIQFFDAPHGINITAPFLDRPLTFDYASIQIRLPYHFPKDLTRDSLLAWQKSNDPFYIPNIVLGAQTISAIGSGVVSLDENLQITADIQARVIGMDSLLDDLEKEQGQKTIAMARRFLDMMAKTDEKTGQKYFETTLKIQNRAIYFGPMRISSLPEIIWDGDHNPHDPLLIRRQRP